MQVLCDGGEGGVGGGGAVDAGHFECEIKRGDPWVALVVGSVSPWGEAFREDIIVCVCGCGESGGCVGSAVGAGGAPVP